MKIKKTLLKRVESKSQTSQQTLADGEGAVCKTNGTDDITTAQPESEFETEEQRICKTTGTHDINTALRFLSQVSVAQEPSPPAENSTHSRAIALSTLQGMAPQSATEAMLATQMIAAHEASLKFLHISTLDDQPNVLLDLNLLRAARLMRLFSQQAETMQKLKGKATPPNLVVGHVDVHHGGQAIVGSATVSKGEAE
jgi:hypothetical protein